MEEIVGIFDSIALILMGVIGGVAVISLGIAALLYMNAHGDPQQQQKAKNAFIGAVIGIIMAGLAYVIPGIISDVIVTPAGGESLRVESTATDCDNLLKTQLVQQVNVNTAARMNTLISSIQSQRENCRTDNWRPRIHDLGSAVPNTIAAGATKTTRKTDCFDLPAANTSDGFTVNRGIVPIGLRVGDSQSAAPQQNSGRDRNNNIIVYFQTAAGAGDTPGDGTTCWLYRDGQGWFSGGPVNTT